MLMLPDTVTTREVADTLRAARQVLDALDPGEPLVVDGGALLHFDSAALAVVLECRRLAEAAGRRCTVRGLPQRLRELARLYGIAEVIGEAEAA
jgi:phospholipid transport system transporter-binding protein